MAIDYTGIVEKVVEILNDGLPETTVTMEPDIIGANLTSEIGVSLADEDNDEEEIGNSDPYMVTLNINILCSEFSPDGVKEASQKRDTLVGNVRDILKGNRDLDELVLSTQLGKTFFDKSRGEAGYFSGALMKLKVYLQA